jgi:small subunit ribosomal protein S6
MFLLDNQVVRADWTGAKKVVTDALAKHSAQVVTSRRWDERRLAYMIKGRKRATYLLGYFNAPEQEIQNLRRDLELDERILRYIIVRTEAVPPEEIALGEAEQVAGWAPPPPPNDDDMSRAEREGGFGGTGETPQQEEVVLSPDEEAIPAMEEV